MDVAFDGSWWSYVLVVVAAAIPAVEVLVVVPAAILAGMTPEAGDAAGAVAPGSSS